MLKYNLQFFAKDGPGGEKTEPASAKKLSDARKDGQVAKSKELGNGLLILSLFISLKMFIGSVGNAMLGLFPAFYLRIPEMVKMPNSKVSVKNMTSILFATLTQTLLIVAPFFIVAVLVSFLGDYIQVKWKPTTKPLKPKFSNMNPIKGMKRIFSSKSMIELLRSVIKIGLIGYIVYDTLIDQVNAILSLYDISLMQGIGLIGDIIINLGIKVSVFYMVLAAADYAYEKWKFSEDMKMTKQEVKDEFKNAEGNPEIKGKIRAKMREVSRRRMMKSIPTADVIITNPTHFAVAIKYDPDVSDAPLVVAKGQDYLAQRIKEIGKENHVEIIENKPLARMLYANVEVGEMVPPELYQAVAEILAMVYRMQGKV